jgi:hypothetical protein
MKHNFKTYVIPIIVILAIIFIGYFIWQHQKNKGAPDLDTLTLSQAAREGQMTEMKLLVQIETPQGRPEEANSRLERGDVVLAKPADWQFSDAEKSGFLIIKVKLTPTLADLIVQPLNKKFGSEASKNSEELKRRKFAVDLKKIGIQPEDEKGREIDDKTFDWNILIQK